MTTFTIQDLTPAQLINDHLNAPEVPRETKDALEEIINTRNINNLPNTPEEDEAMRELFEKMGRDLANQEIAHQQEQQALLDAVPPQPSAEVLHNSKVSPEAVIDEMLYTIKQSLLLLATVISQPKAQPDTTPPEGDQPSLQETVALVLQQSDWFKDMVAQHLKDMGVDDIAESVVENLVERDVDHYFSNSFDPTDHFDFNDAVQDAVSDQIDDIVSDKMEDAVDAYLSGATISINK
jgi:hypothetical protein